MKQLWIETGLSCKHTCRTNSCRFHPWIMLIHLKSLVTNSPTIIDITINQLPTKGAKNRPLRISKIGPPAATACPCPVLLVRRRTWRSRSGPLAEIGPIRWLKVTQRSIASSAMVHRWPPVHRWSPWGFEDTDFTGAKVSWAKTPKQNVTKKPWQSSNRAMFSMAQGIIRMQMVTSEGTANRQCNVSNQTISHPQLYQKWVPQ